MIYFITDGYFVKVGTAKSLKKRLAQMKSANPLRLIVLASCEGDHDLEQLLHSTLPGRVDGSLEWYHPTPAILRFVRRVQDHGGRAVHSRIAAKERLRAYSRKQAILQANEFKVRSTALIRELCDKYGVRKIAEITQQTEAAVRFNRQGLTQVGALSWARIGMIEPEKVNTLIVRAERIAA